MDADQRTGLVVERLAQALLQLVRERKIAKEDALANSDSPTNLLWRLQNEQAPISRIASTER